MILNPIAGLLPVTGSEKPCLHQKKIPQRIGRRI